VRFVIDLTLSINSRLIFSIGCGGDDDDVIRVEGYVGNLLGNLGDDDIEILHGVVITIDGNDGNDLIKIDKKAEVNYIHGKAGNDTVYNYGLIIGGVDLGADDDYFFNAKDGFIQGYAPNLAYVNGSGGNDLIINEGYIYNINGNAGSDEIINRGFVGVGGIHGGAGNDHIDVETGAVVNGPVVLAEALDNGKSDFVRIDGSVQYVENLNDLLSHDKIVVGTEGFVVQFIHGLNEVEIKGSVGAIVNTMGVAGDANFSVSEGAVAEYIENYAGKANVDIHGRVGHVRLGGGKDFVKIQNSATVDYIYPGLGADEIVVESGAKLFRVYGANDDFLHSSRRS